MVTVDYLIHRCRDQIVDHDQFTGLTELMPVKVPDGGTKIATEKTTAAGQNHALPSERVGHVAQAFADFRDVRVNNVRH